jgi:acetylglutamate kinase
VATVLKLGGELLEDDRAVAAAALAIVRLASRGPLAVIHGGGRAIDAELRVRGIAPRFADGLRVTDRATLDSVLAVLAGRTNTALVAAIGAAGGRPATSSIWGSWANRWRPMSRSSGISSGSGTCRWWRASAWRRTARCST